jgi:predicted methyltransferase
MEPKEEAGGGFRGAWKGRVYLTKELVEEYKKGKRELSLDLGRSITIVTNELDSVPLDDVKGEFVYAWDGKELWKVAVFDGGLYRLRMMKGKPILEIDGLRMHLIKEFDDVLDYSKLVVRGLGVKEGDSVLDTCMGLGYTAIEAYKKAGGLGKAGKVVTVELSPAVIAMAKWNPWSRELFDGGIEVVGEKSCYDYVQGAKDGQFDRIIHDPPRFSKAGELYSRKFYTELFRICKKGGKLFHYVGSLGEKRRDIMGEAAKRLEECGWKVVKKDKRLQGIFAVRA